MNLDSLFQNLLTSGIRLSAPETLRKMRVLNALQLVFIVAAPLLGGFYFYIGALQLFYVSIGAGFLMLSSFFLLRGTKNLALGSHFVVLILWAFLLLVLWLTGAVTYEGVLGPTFILHAGLILLAIFLLGYSGGAVWAMIVFLESGIIIHLHRSGFHFPNLIPPEITPLYSLGTNLVALLCILLFAFLFEKEKGDVLLLNREKAEALRESKRYIDDILRNTPVPTFIIDRNHRVVHWNSACEELTGVAAGEILGKRSWEGFFLDNRRSVADLILTDDRILEEDYKDRIISANGNGWFELKLSLPLLKGGAEAVVTASPILDEAGAVRGAIQTIRPRGNAEDRESALGGATSRIGEDCGPPAFKVDAQAKITYWNGTCERLYQYSSSEMIGKDVFMLLPKNYRPLFKATIDGVLEGKSFTGQPFKYLVQEGRAVYVLAEAYPVPGSQEDARECLIVNTDITDLRLKMKRLERYAVETREKLKGLTDEYNLLKRNIASFIRKKQEPSS